MLYNIDFHYGRCWPLDLALWDLAGKITGQPCWKLLGGLSNRVRAYASSGTLRDPGAWPTPRSAIWPKGFRALKIRFHRGDWRDDIKALEAVRARVGGRLDLMVDCNQGWRMPWDAEAPWSLKDALTVARELERLGVYWMEEPLHRGDHAGMRRLREQADVRIAGGEMTRELYEFRDLIDGRLPRCAAARRGAGGRHHRPATRRADGAGAQPGLHAAHLDERHGRHRQRPSRRRASCDAPFLEFPYDPPEWELRPPRLHDGRAPANRLRRLPKPHRYTRNGLRPGRGQARSDPGRLTPMAKPHPAAIL